MEQVELKNRKGHCLSILSLFIVGILGCTHLSGVFLITKYVYFWDSGTPTERMIIFNNKDDVRSIVSGIPIVPSNAEYQSNAEVGNTEYVERYSFDGEWLLANTILITDSVSLSRYWIVRIPDNMEHRIDGITRLTFGPLDLSEFDSIISLNSINVSEFSSQ